MDDDSSPSPSGEDRSRRGEGGHGEDRGRRREGRGDGGRRFDRGDRRDRGGRGDRGDRAGRDRGDRRGGRDGGGRGGGDRGGGRKYFGPKEGHERRPRGGGGGEAPGSERTFVLPGEEIPAEGMRPGLGTYREGDKIYASMMGFVSPRPPFMRVVPLAGRYIPQRDDMVIGVVQMVGPTYWLLDIRAPHFTPMHMTGTPWQMDYGETGEYLRPRETVVVRVEGIDEARRIGVSMNGPGLGKLEGGFLMEISPARVPRVIGRSGSMIQMIQNATRTRLVVGQNGRIWIEGSDTQIRRVREVLELIDDEGQRPGLTDRVKALLDAQRPPRAPAPGERAHHGPSDSSEYEG